MNPKEMFENALKTNTDSLNGSKSIKHETSLEKTSSPKDLFESVLKSAEKQADDNANNCIAKESRAKPQLIENHVSSAKDMFEQALAAASDGPTNAVPGPQNRVNGHAEYVKTR